jgi:hypothetical protein
MGLEAATYIHELVATNPVGAVDPKSQGDDHLRLLKATIQATFPNIEGAVTITHTQLNALAASALTGFAAPSVAVDLAAGSEGVATTALRSDAKLQLSQAIAPTWSAAHSFTRNRSAAGEYGILQVCAQPANLLYATGAPANEKGWRMSADSGGTFFGQAMNDADNAGGIWLQVDRTGITIDSITLNATTVAMSAGVTARNINTTAAGGNNLGLRAQGDGTNDVEIAVATSGGGDPYFCARASGVVDWSIGSDRSSGEFQINNSVGLAASLFRFTQSGDLIVDGGVDTGNTGLFDNGARVIDIPRRTSGFIRGQCLAVSAGVTLNTGDMAAGYTYSLYNDSGSDVTVTQGAGVTLRLAGTTSTGNRTLAARGFGVIWCNSGTEAIISGNVS